MKRMSAAKAALLLALPAALVAGAEGKERRLLVPVAGYPGHIVGKKNPPSGLLSSADGGKSWTHTAWEELIANSLAVDASGRRIYLACGNGVMVSSDAGAHWKLTGGWELTEVARVAIDRRDPRRAWAASAYGIFRTEDALNWTAERNPGRPRYASDVLQDAADPRRIWAATEEGVFVSVDEGVSFRRSGPPCRARRLAQDRTQSLRLWAATDGQGMLETADGGKTWTQVTGAPPESATVLQDPRDPARLLCGIRGGVAVRRAGTWRSFSLPLPEALVTDLAFDGDRVYAATTEGLFKSSDGAQTWERAGLDGALLNGVWLGKLAQYPPEPLPTEAPPFQVPNGPRKEGFREGDYAAFDLRRAQLRAGIAGSAYDPAKGPPDFFQAIARIREGKDDEAFWKALDARLDRPEHSMFFTMPALAFYLHCRDRIPAPLAEKIRFALTENPAYRGDTENHWVMHYSTVLLSAQLWPDTPPSRWHTGRTSREAYEEAKTWLMRWSRLTATRGQGEFDSPHYLFMYVTPLFLLYDFAQDPEVRQMAGMSLDLLLADYLTESLGGAYCGAHSRVDDANLVQRAQNTPAVYHFLFAGGVPLPEHPRSWAAAAAYSSYRPPAMFPALANRRERPYAQTEVKRLRNAIRHAPELNPPVFKYDWMAPDFCLGSARGGILQPIQQHTWDATWRSAAKNPVLFTVQPHVSGRELSTFFPGDEKTLVRLVAAAKNYDTPDKWVSASPYERIRQRENVLLALYQVPPGEKFPEVSLYWPSCLKRREEKGWLLGGDGDFSIAVFPCQPGTWTEEGDHARLRCRAQRAGFVVVAGEKGLPGQTPVLSGEGDGLTMTLGDLSLRWDRADPFPSDRLFKGPFLNARAGEGIVEMTDGRRTRRLDFNRLEVLEEVK